MFSKVADLRFPCADNFLDEFHTRVGHQRGHAVNWEWKPLKLLSIVISWILTLIIHHLQNVKVCSQKYHLYIDLELQLSSVDCSGREEVHF